MSNLPRFKVGDWVRMSGSTLFLHITRIDTGYHYDVYQGSKCFYASAAPLYFDKHWKLVSDEEKAQVL